MEETTKILPEAPEPSVEIFPKADVEAQLATELIKAAKVAAELQEIDVPETSAGQRSMETTIDSLVVVELLITVEPILGIELKDGVVREGGYVSVEKAIEHLLPRIEKEWIKRKGKRHE